MPQITKQYKFCAAHKYWNDKIDTEFNKLFPADIMEKFGYDLSYTILS